MKLLNYLLINRWLEENPEPLWNGGKVIVGYYENTPDNKKRVKRHRDWERNHSIWIRKVFGHLGIELRYERGN